MVRKSFLVYELLRTEQPQNGFSEREIVEQISNKLDITAGKGLRRQVAVALRRGLDFGILTKRNQKFRFDPDNAKIASLKRTTSSKTSRGKKKKKRKNSKRTKKPKARSNSENRNKNRTKQNRTLPDPSVPKSWVPNRRNLNDEPLSKVKKI